MTALWVALGIIALTGLALALLAHRRARTLSAPGLAPDLRRIYTTHARQRMLQRDISQAQVESVLVAPDRVERDDKENSMRFERKLESMTVKVWVAADPWPPIDKVVVKTTAARHFGSLTIPREAVGRVIGRGGATIQGIRDATKAKIVVRDGGVVDVQADDRASVERAHRMINEIAVNGTNRFPGK